MANPLVTVAIPTFNRCGLLEGALASALAQTFPDLEVLVCDNASTDGTEAFMVSRTDGRIRYHRQPENRGLLGNWNTCLELARGTHFLLLSDDDRLRPGALEDLIALHREDPEGLAFIYGLCEISDPARGMRFLSRTAPRQEPSPAYREGYLRNTRVNYPSATLLLTRLAREVGGYSEDLGFSIDTSLAFRVSALRPRIGCTGKAVADYALHPGNYTFTQGLGALIQSMQGISGLAVDLAEGPKAVRKARATAHWSVASAAGQHLMDQLTSRRIHRSEGISEYFKLLKYHGSGTALPLLVKLTLKMLLFCLADWRGIKPPQAPDPRRKP